MYLHSTVEDMNETPQLTIVWTCESKLALTEQLRHTFSWVKGYRATANAERDCMLWR